MASAAASMRVSLPSPRGGMRHALPSPVSPRLKPASLNLPKEDPFSFVVRAARVYCSGELLAAVQMCEIFEDCKEFVDMPMRKDPEHIIQAFHDLPVTQRKDPVALRNFLHQHFDPPGSDIVPHIPHDHTSSPRLLYALDGHETYRSWASELNEFWKELCRRVSEDVHKNQQRYSILRKDAPFIIPGGRFRESYYWDSYWIVLGLLACDMKDTAKGLVSNLLDDVAMFGFVPNGGRLYYLNRSQPPLLSDMVFALLEDDPHLDERWLAEALQVLNKEYAFWLREGERAVTLRDAQGEDHVLNRYWTRASTPRPESFREDLHNAMRATCAQGFYADVAAGAESGWDFSSRWMKKDGKGEYLLQAIATTSIVPVDLNAFLYRMERNMARMHEFLHLRQTGSSHAVVPSEHSVEWESPVAQRYADASDRRALAMDRLLWSHAEGQWKDYWMPSGRHHTAPEDVVLSSSNFVPLWARVLHNQALQHKTHDCGQLALQALENSGLLEVGGIRTTTKETEEQWDAPNAWSPIQHMIIEGLEGLGTPQASSLALRLTKDWLASNHLGWANTGQMYEKYSATLAGARGEGGEYYPQVGFGWTNGVVLHLLKAYAHKL